MHASPLSTYRQIKVETCDSVLWSDKHHTQRQHDAVSHVIHRHTLPSMQGGQKCSLVFGDIECDKTTPMATACESVQHHAQLAIWHATETVLRHSRMCLPQSIQQLEHMPLSWVYDVPRGIKGIHNLGMFPFCPSVHFLGDSAATL